MHRVIAVFLRIAAYLFHPLLMPLFGVMLYYSITPKYVEPEIIKANFFSIVIITILIPIITFFLFKNLRIINDINLENVKERKFPLMVQILLILLIVKMVFSVYESPELYFFFIGILFSTLATLILVLFNYKVSLHQIGITGVTMFLVALSVHFKINILFIIGALLFFVGWVASSRLYTKSHTLHEIIIGFFVGLIPQLIVLNLWL